MNKISPACGTNTIWCRSTSRSNVSKTARGTSRSTNASPAWARKSLVNTAANLRTRIGSICQLLFSCSHYFLFIPSDLLTPLRLCQNPDRCPPIRRISIYPEHIPKLPRKIRVIMVAPAGVLSCYRLYSCSDPCLANIGSVDRMRGRYEDYMGVY